MLWEISIVACSVSSAVPELCREIKNSSQIQRVCAEGFLGSLLYHLYHNDLENFFHLLIVKSISLVFLQPPAMKVWSLRFTENCLNVVNLLLNQ